MGAIVESGQQTIHDILLFENRPPYVDKVLNQARATLADAQTLPYFPVLKEKEMLILQSYVFAYMMDFNLMQETFEQAGLLELFPFHDTISSDQGNYLSLVSPGILERTRAKERLLYSRPNDSLPLEVLGSAIAYYGPLVTTSERKLAEDILIPAFKNFSLQRKRLPNAA